MMSQKSICEGGYHQEGENVVEYVAGLRRLSEHGRFGKMLEDMLRVHRLVCGINDDRIQRKGNSLLRKPWK